MSPAQSYASPHFPFLRGVRGSATETDEPPLHQGLPRSAIDLATTFAPFIGDLPGFENLAGLVLFAACMPPKPPANSFHPEFPDGN